MYEVFIVEDEPPIADMIAEMVNEAPGDFHAARIAHDGQTMLDILAKLKPDLLLADIRMPVMDGLELIGKAKALYPDLICIVLTSYAEFEYARIALQIGVFDYILKTRLPESLFEILGKARLQLEQTALGREKEYFNRVLLTRDSGGVPEPDFGPLRYIRYQAVLVTMPGARDPQPTTAILPPAVVRHDFGLVGAGRSLELLCFLKDLPPAADEPGIVYGEPFDRIGEFPRMVTQLFDRLEAESSGDKNGLTDARQAVQELRDYLDSHVEEPFDIRGKYILGGYNALYLARIFNATFGISPKRYHTRAKIQLVQRLLAADPGLLLKEAAIRVNFEDELYLAKVFKQETGYTYTDYRKRFCPES